MLARLNQPSVQRTVPAIMPAPVKGINATVSLANQDPEECINCFNMIPLDLGMEVREGYIEWANGWIGGPAKTVIAYEGLSDSLDKLFVASPEGIFDVTTFGETSPTQVVTFLSSGGNAGICSYVQYVNDGGFSFLLLCDGENGYYTYDRVADTWLKVSIGAGPTDIDNVDPDLFDYVMVWKNRVWFIERESTNAWYLNPGSIYGTVAQFNFGTQVREGGELRQLVNWTLDGGDGVDDYLVAITGSGDIIIYQGYDPAQASTFQVVGTWFAGKLPAGRRVASTFGGEVYLLCVYGLIPLSQLLQGAAIADKRIQATNNVSPYLRAIMAQVLNDFGWHVHIHPRQSLLFVNTPDRTPYSEPTLAFVMYYPNFAWGIVRDLNKNHTANWQGNVFWCDSQTNKVYLAGGSVDGVYLDQETDGVPEPIDWSVLTSYQYINGPINKRVQYVRPVFLSGADPAYTLDVRYDFDIAPIDTFPALVGGGEALWGVSLWGVARWSGGTTPYFQARGGNGIGRAVAIAIKGRTASATTLASFELQYDSGGLM